MKYRVQSADVLNEADRFERILDWQLFQYDQAVVLYQTNDVSDWVPGKPLFTDPRKQPGYYYSIMDGADGNHVRPMFEIFDTHGYARCESCEVDWEGHELFCWFCGQCTKEFGPKYRDPLVFNPDYQPRNIFEGVGFGVRGMRWGSRQSSDSAEMILSMHFDVNAWIREELRVNLFEHQARLMQEYSPPVFFSWAPILDEWENGWNGANPLGLVVTPYEPPSVEPEWYFRREIPERIVSASVSESAAEPLVENPTDGPDALWRRANPSLRIRRLWAHELRWQRPAIPERYIPVPPPAREFHTQTAGVREIPITQRRRTRG